MTDPLLTTGDLLTVVLLVVVGAAFMVSLLVMIADRPWHAPRHDVADDLTTLLPSRTAVPVGERSGGVRVAGPGAATTPITVPATAPITPRPYVTRGGVYDQAPVLVVDSPPGARGKLPTPDLGVPVVVVPSCSLCHRLYCSCCGRMVAIREDNLLRLSDAAAAIYPGDGPLPMRLDLMPEVDWTADVSDEVIGRTVLDAVNLPGARS